MARTDLIFPLFCCIFCSSIPLSLYVFYSMTSGASFNFDSSVISLNQSQFIAIYRKQSAACFFCVHDRLCQIACLFVLQSGQRFGFQVKLKNFEVSELPAFCLVFLYFIKSLDSMLLCLCSVIHHRRCQTVVRISVTHSTIASCATYLFLSHFDVISDLLLNKHTTTWNLVVK